MTAVWGVQCGAENLTSVCGLVGNGNVWCSNHFGPMAMWVLNATDQWAFSERWMFSWRRCWICCHLALCVPSPVVLAVGMLVSHRQFNAYIPTGECVCMCTYVCVCMCTYVRTCVCMCTYMCAFVDVCICLLVCVCTYVCVQMLAFSTTLKQRVLTTD